MQTTPQIQETHPPIAKNPPTPLASARRRLLADVERDLALGKEPPRLEFNSAVNYTYNRHAEALHALFQAKDAGGLAAYKLGGVNTYARALQRYRDLLLQHLGGTVQ